MVIPGKPSKSVRKHQIVYSLQNIAGKTVKEVQIKLDVSIGAIFLALLPVLITLLVLSLTCYVSGKINPYSWIFSGQMPNGNLFNCSVY